MRKPHPTGIYDRQRLAAGAALRGPAVIVEYSATTVVPPDFACEVDEHLNLVLERKKTVKNFMPELLTRSPGSGGRSLTTLHSRIKN